MLAVILAQAASPSPSPGGSTDANPVLHPDMTFSIVLGLVCLAALMVAAHLLLPRLAGRVTGTDAAGKPINNFFQIPYITWYLLHSSIAMIGITAVVILGLDNIIDKGTVAALLGSLFGYIFGAVSAARGQQTGSTAGAPATPAVTNVVDEKGENTRTLTLLGSNLDQVKSVSLSSIDVPPDDVSVVNSGALQVKVPMPIDAAVQPGPIKLNLANGNSVKTSQTFTP